MRYTTSDIRGIAQVSIDKDEKIYVEYTSKKDNVLKSMEVFVKSINEDHLIVIDDADDGIKRLNFDRIYRIGIKA